MCIIFCFYLFSSWGNLPLQSYWSLSCDPELLCSDELTTTGGYVHYTVEYCSVGDSSVGDSSVGDSSAGDSSVGDSSVGDGSVGDSSATGCQAFSMPLARK